LGILTGLRGLSTRQRALAAAVAVALGFLLYTRLSTLSPENRPSRTRAGRPGAAAPELPRIDLARLASPAPGGKAGRRDLFEFGLLEAEKDGEEEQEEPIAPSRPTPQPVVMANPELAPPVAPRLVAITLKYIGSLETQGGPKVAVLLTDRNEILYGQVGQQVANRFKIMRIGFESVEVLDEGSGQSRRIPLKGN